MASVSKQLSSSKQQPNLVPGECPNTAMSVSSKAPMDATKNEDVEA
jgi:hypothetical protein